MRQTFVIIIIFGILTSCSSIKNSSNTEITGKYEAYYDFERLGFTKTLKLNKNGKFTMIRSMNSSTPSYIEFGKWKSSNDSIYLYKKKIKIDKHNRAKKRKILCESQSEFNPCRNDTLAISGIGLYEVIDNMQFEKITR